MYKIVGKVKEVLFSESAYDSKYDVYQVVLEVKTAVKDKEYDNSTAIDFKKEIYGDISGKIQVGDVVEIDFNLLSNFAKTGKWFTNIAGFKYNVLSSNASTSTPQKKTTPKTAKNKPLDNDDDQPF